MVLGTDLGKMTFVGSILFHMFDSGISEKLGSWWSSTKSTLVIHDLHELLHGIGAIIKHTGERSRSHLLKSEGNGTVTDPTSNGLSGEEESTGSGGAIVVHVQDGDLGHSDLVESALSAGGISIAVTNDGLLNLIVGYSCVHESFGDGFLCHILIESRKKGNR